MKNLIALSLILLTPAAHAGVLLHCTGNQIEATLIAGAVGSATLKVKTPKANTSIALSRIGFFLEPVSGPMAGIRSQILLKKFYPDTGIRIFKDSKETYTAEYIDGPLTEPMKCDQAAKSWAAIQVSPTILDTSGATAECLSDDAARAIIDREWDRWIKFGVNGATTTDGEIIGKRGCFIIRVKVDARHFALARSKIGFMQGTVPVEFQISDTAVAM